MSADLLPCPFCGGPAELDHWRPYRNYRTSEAGTGISISCLSCGAELMTCRQDIPDVTSEEVITAWNTRASASVTPGPDAEEVAATRQQEPGEALNSLSPLAGDQGALVEAKDIAWLERQKEFGHCGESTSECIQRQRVNECIDRILTVLAQASTGGAA